jgi:hypothetical protein
LLRFYFLGEVFGRAASSRFALPRVGLSAPSPASLCSQVVPLLSLSLPPASRAGIGSLRSPLVAGIKYLIRAYLRTRGTKCRYPRPLGAEARGIEAARTKCAYQAAKRRRYERSEPRIARRERSEAARPKKLKIISPSTCRVRRAAAR